MIILYVFRVSGSRTMKKLVIFVFLLLFLIALSGITFGSTPALRVVVTEYVSETIAYDQTYGNMSDITEARGEPGENRTNTSRTGVELQEIYVSGIINISNVESVGSQTLVSLNITMNGTQDITSIGLDSAPPGNYLVYNLSEGTKPSSASNISFFIAELRANHNVIFVFNVSGTGIGEPLNFTENYTSWRVMTGDYTHVILNATNSFPRPITLYDIAVYKTPERYDRIGGGYVYFNYTNLTGQDAASGVIYTDGDGRSILNWNCSGGDLTTGETSQIQFESQAPLNLSVNWTETSDWATWMNMGNLSASFKFNGSMTGIGIENISAVSPAARFSVSKDRTNQTHWNATVNITNDAVAPLDYNLTQVTVWATKYNTYNNPGDINTWINQTNVTAFGFGTLLGPYANMTWWPNVNLSGGSWNDSQSITFNYSLVPIVWATADFMILDDGTQIFKLNKSESVDEGYLFIEEIYVLLGGYLMKVTKIITPLQTAGAQNRYLINITIENIGTERSPDWVSMFDLVPKGFWPRVYIGEGPAPERNMTLNNVIRATDSTGSWVNLPISDMTWGYADTGNIASGPFQDYWGYHIDFVGLNATSNGDGFYTANMSTKEVGVSYKIQGNYTISSIENAYIIGVDPIRLEGANPSRSIASLLGATSDSWEYVILISSLSISISILGVGLRYLMVTKGKRRRRKQ